MLCSVVVAVVGLLGSLLIYVRAGDDSDENMQIVIVDGKAYKVPLASTKTYQRELRRIGGEAAVLFDDINRWFASVFRGRSLAVVTASITVLVSVGLFLVARDVPSERDSDDRGDAKPG